MRLKVSHTHPFDHCELLRLRANFNFADTWDTFKKSHSCTYFYSVDLAYMLFKIYDASINKKIILTINTHFSVLINKKHLPATIQILSLTLYSWWA